MPTNETVARAWKDPAYRATLTPAEQHALPPHPAGLVELTDAELMETDGGTTLACVVYVTVALYVAACSYIKSEIDKALEPE